MVGDIIAHTEWMPSRKYGIDNPKISVLLPTFRRCNSGLFLKAATSVLKQSVDELELIIIDDGSTDGTADQIRELMQKDGRVSCLRHPRNVGLPAISEYEGYMKARAEFLAFAFDDTEFRPTALEELLNVANISGLPFMHGYVEMSVYEEASGITQVVPLGKGCVPQSTLRSHNYIPNNAVIFNKKVIERVGLYDPHICMARLCDWDLWRRVAECYKIHAADVFVGYEHGPNTSDSLGKTVLMDLWTVNEWMKNDRNEVLKPERFVDYDVLAIPSHLTRQAKFIIKDLEDQYRDKFWFRDVPFFLSGSVSRTESGVSPAENRKNNGYILVIAPVYDACVSLYFDYLPGHLGQQVRIIQGSAWTGCEEEMAGASAVVIIRNLFDFSLWTDYAKKIGVPLYYFTDDNFMELRNDKDCPPEFRHHSPPKIRKMLEGFAGVLLSTQRLLECFREHDLHEKLYYYPPIAKTITNRRPSTGRSEFTIAFMGGVHRSENFYRYLVPAIKRLAEDVKIRLCVPWSEQERQNLAPLLAAQNENLMVEVIPRDISYDLTLRNFREFQPDALVHINSDTGNNLYKTQNVFINAMLLGAVPVVSDEEPYCSVKGDNICLFCDRDENSWYSSLRWIFQNKPEAARMSGRLQLFCSSNYSGELNEKVLGLILSEHAAPSLALRDARYKNLAKCKDPGNQSETIKVLRWVWRKIRFRFGGSGR